MDRSVVQRAVLKGSGSFYMSFLQTSAVNPVEALGLILVFAACALLLVDLAVTNHGMPAAGGMVTLLLGGLLLSGVAAAHPLATLVILTAATALTGALFAAVARGRLAVMQTPAKSGPEAMVGEEGVAKEAIGAATPGWVLVHGERWRAVLAVAPEDAHNVNDDHRFTLRAGSRVLVVGFEDGKVLVTPPDEQPAPPHRRRRKPEESW